MGVLYVAGRGPGVGATAIVAGLATLWRQAGRRVAAIKPISTAGDDPDCAFLAHVAGNTPLMPRTADARDAVAADVERLAAENDVVIVEGLSLTGADGHPDTEPVELARRLGAKIAVVSEGAVQDAALRESLGDSFAGVIVNRLPRFAFVDWSADYLLGVMPEDRLLIAPTVRQVVEHIGGSYFAGPFDEERFVEHVIIGALITEWGGNYFGRLPNQGVVVRGGRLDIQLAALNFDINCLVLTGCDLPPQYTFLRAEERRIPLVTVAADTAQTAGSLESVQSRSSIHFDAKAERAAALLGKTVRWEELNAVVGLS